MKDAGNPARMRAFTPRRIVLAGWMLLLALLFPGAVLGAGETCVRPSASTDASPAQGKLAELDEVVVSPRKIVTRTKDLGEWLKRLEGQYRYEGHVDLCGNGNATDQLPVSGSADCVSLYSRGSEHLLSMYCALDVRWLHPERDSHRDGRPIAGVSNLSPAVVVYGVVPELHGIQSMQVDSNGIATHASGRLSGDTLTTIEPCGVGDSCRKVTRITARRDTDEVVVLVDFEVDSRRAARQAFLLNRVSNLRMRDVQNTLVTRDDLPSVGQR